MGRNAIWNLTNTFLASSHNVTLAATDDIDVNLTVTIITIWLTAVVLLMWALHLGSKHCSAVRQKSVKENDLVKEVPPPYEEPPDYNVALQMSQM